MKNTNDILKTLNEAEKLIRGSKLSPETFNAAKDQIIKLAVTLSYTRHPDYPLEDFEQIKLRTLG